MAENEKNEKTEVAAKEQSAKKSVDKPEKKKPNFFDKTAKFFREYRSELKKVVWSTKEQLVKNFVLVAVSVVVTGAGIGILDFVFNTGLTALGKLI